ncbi:hypothetical protein RF55_23100 [Lasius niger]|uniref:Uncharacterized protein n=1 Tax=Lasius niger TaxID=67767 RepID=A0A0J7JWA5_LASNI|nr:hypothetical protein RF55_23100 [Lasius niger]
MERKNAGAERKKKGDGGEKKDGGIEGEGDENVVACEEKDGKKGGGDVEKSMFGGGKKGEVRKRGGG